MGLPFLEEGIQGISIVILNFFWEKRSPASYWNLLPPRTEHAQI